MPTNSYEKLRPTLVGVVEGLPPKSPIGAASPYIVGRFPVPKKTSPIRVIGGGPLRIGPGPPTADGTILGVSSKVWIFGVIAVFALIFVRKFRR